MFRIIQVTFFDSYKLVPPAAALLARPFVRPSFSLLSYNYILMTAKGDELSDVSSNQNIHRTAAFKKNLAYLNEKMYYQKNLECCDKDGKPAVKCDWKLE